MSKMGKKSDLESLHLLNHSKCMLAAFQNFRMDETMLDVTLICNGLKLKAHKLILSACSPLFKEMINENPCAHPIILFRNFDFCDLKAVIDFVYKGELSVPRERLMSALKVAEELHIRGLRRSEPNREKYEKLYNQVRGKLSGKKKRKRLHRNSSDSENELYNISDSDDQSAGSGASLNAKDKMTLSETQQMDVESTDMEKDSANDKDIRPVVLRVGDHTSSNEESNSKNVFEYEENSVVNPVEQSSSDMDSQKEHLVSLNEETEGQTYESTTENIANSSHQDSFISCSDNANTPLTVDPEAEESKIKEEPTSESFEGSPKEMKSISSSSPKTAKIQLKDENQKLPDEGKRFICSKCDSVFTSRINFMKHKATGHSTSAEKKYPYKCQQCTFTSEDFDSLKNHLLTHLRSEVPFKCHVCAEEFSSEELYRQHESVHESQKISLPDVSSSSSAENAFWPQNKIPEKIVEFRCSICFARFTSKLRCQLHEKTCEGGS